MVDAVIRLFPSSSVTFQSNGIGYLPDAISCEVIEERNGAFELTMVYPINGLRYSEIMTRRLILAKSNPFSEPQPFRIYRITKPINGKITIYAEHISYDLSGMPVNPFTAMNAQDALLGLKKNSVIPCNFTFMTDKTTTANFGTAVPISIRTLLGGVEGSILDTYKGEYEFDRYIVHLWNNRGMDRGVTIRYGKNLTDLEQDENIETLYTGVLPWWYSDLEGNTGYVQGTVVDCPGEYNFKRILSLDCSYDFEDIPTVEQLTEFAKGYIERNSVGVPKVSIDVSFVNLADSEEFRDIAISLETIHLCDTVNIEYSELGIKATAKCIKTKYDVLNDKYIGLELGDAKLNLSDTLASNNDKLAEDFKKQLISTTDTTTEEFKNDLEKTYSDLFSKIVFGDEQVSNDLNDKILESASELNGKIDRDTNALDEKIDQTSESLLGDLQNMQNEVNDELIQMDKDLKKLIKETAEAEATKREEAIAYSTQTITGNLGGYVVLHSSTNADYPDEILVMDTENYKTAKKIWRWNKSGLGYSNTGYNGPYGLAITQDGVIVADYIQTGKLNASLITTGVMNASLITAGYMSADRIFGGTLVLGGAKNGNGMLILRDVEEKVLASMTNAGLNIYKGKINGPAITIGGVANASGVVTVLGPDGEISGQWSNVGLYMYGTYRYLSNNYEGYVVYNGLTLECSALLSGSAYTPIYYQGSVELPVYSTSGTKYVPVYGYWTKDYRMALGFLYQNSDETMARRNTITMVNHNFSGASEDHLTFEATASFVDRVTVGGELRALQLSVTGTKNRIVDTESFGTVSLNAIESPEAIFNDFGSGKISEVGDTFIFFDPLFLEVIEDECEYQVFVTKTSKGNIDFVEKKDDCFVVHGTPNLEFDWQIACKQRDYSSIRFEEHESITIPEQEERVADE